MSLRFARIVASLGIMLFSTMVPLARAAGPFRLLIEAEEYTSKASSDKSFAAPTKLDYTSRGNVLTRFYIENSYCLYRFDVPSSKRYYGWLRYSSLKTNNTLRCAIQSGVAEPGGAIPFKGVFLPSTGATEGPKAWRWTRIFDANLKAGPHTLALGNSPIRPDCVLITDSAEPPTDDIISIQDARAIDDRPRVSPAKPVEPISPEWLDDAGNYRLPEWFDKIRVCMHTRLNISYRREDVFLTAGKRFASLGAKSIVRHIKSGPEGAWWPSSIGMVLQVAKDRNWAKEIIDEAHANGCRILVYHRHMEDRYLAGLHPDWVCVGPDGKVFERRGPQLCFNSPYIDFIEKRLIELASMGADGFYFDEVHMPREGCWCPFCRKRFKEETGIDAPKSIHEEDPVYRKYVDFKNVTIERTFRRLRKTLHAANPDLVMLIDSYFYPLLIDRHTTHRLYRITDSTKTELKTALIDLKDPLFRDGALARPEDDAKMAMGYLISRDAADGRPAHIWMHGMQNEVSALYGTAGVIAHGNIANLDHAEKTIPDPGTFQKAISLGNQISPILAGARPMKWAAIHWSEHARDQYLPDIKEAYTHVVLPTYGTFATFLRRRLPVCFLTDSQLEMGMLEGYQVLVLPSPQHLTEAMRARVETFRKGGGIVIENERQWQWHDPKGGAEKAETDFSRLLSTQCPLPPVFVTGGPRQMHALPYVNPREGRTAVAIVNDFSWVFCGKTVNKDGTPRNVRIPDQPPPDCNGVVVSLGGGKPRRVYDAVTGKDLRTKVERDRILVDVPSFGPLALVVAEYQ